MRYGDALGPSSMIDIERHGAIRLGTARELHTVRRILAIIGLYPVGYYDLTPARLPHARRLFPTKNKRITLQRLLQSIHLSPPARAHQGRRRRDPRPGPPFQFTPEFTAILDRTDSQNGRLTPAQSTRFVAAASLHDYTSLKAAHSILADVACFPSAHVSHLTPPDVGHCSRPGGHETGGSGGQGQYRGRAPPPAPRGENAPS
ncbi:hypothetical protein MAC_05439 [Metarhizium acridum CQMa 102]|uniref:2-oxoadipate dioxygenase/decarboxylase n=1 Tax=Metarhizium acridum (strain CQMa 102) TaxID=655827 RepID=E9E6E1_METAQ|nr:uncharacterized protein MAC_05439 [Metarhizium acridum CQMa 102]EFY88545.1 hypothetical protein MAC_05439 [Metarhizium acridum CQMa 102]